MLVKTNSSFYDITDKRLNNLSQLKLFGVLNDPVTNEKVLNIFSSYTVNSKVNSVLYYDLYDVGDDEWWDDISHKYYGTVNLWWMIVMFNDVVNPFEFLEVGIQIKILKPSYIYQVIKEIKTIGNL